MVRCLHFLNAFFVCICFLLKSIFWQQNNCSHFHFCFSLLPKLIINFCVMFKEMVCLAFDTVVCCFTGWLRDSVQPTHASRFWTLFTKCFLMVFSTGVVWWRCSTSDSGWLCGYANDFCFYILYVLKFNGFLRIAYYEIIFLSSPWVNLVY